MLDNKTVKVTIDADDASMQAALKRTNQGLGSSLGALSAFNTAVVAGTFTMLARDLTNTAVAVDRLNNSMTAATGSISQGLAELNFVREESQRLGLDLLATADAYKGLAAATRGTALEGQKARDIFTAVAEASTSLGLSADETKGALTAISQMISKGTVSAEELRGQLGERLPGAFNIAARSIGVTTGELDTMLKKGQVIAADFLPAFATELQKTFKVSETTAHSAQAEINRFNNAVLAMKSSILTEAGGRDAIISMATAATSMVSGFRSAIAEGYRMAMMVDKLGGSLTQISMLAALPGMLSGSRTAGALYDKLEGYNNLFASRYAQSDTMLQKLANLDAGLNEDGSRRAFVGAATPSMAGGGGRAGGAMGKGSRTAGGFFGQAWDETAAALDLESMLNTQFSTTLSTFGVASMGELSIMGPGGAAQWMTDATAAQQQKWAFQDQMYQSELERETFMFEQHKRMNEETAKADQTLAQRQLSIKTNYLGAFGSVLQAAQSLTGGHNKALYAMTQAASIAVTFLSTEAAAAAALAPPPLGLGPIVGAPLATSIKVAGYASMAAQAAMTIANVAGIGQSGSTGGGQIGYGGGYPGSPIITQPTTNPAEQQGNITIVLKGVPNGKWVEEELIPELNAAGSRNVRIDYVSA